MNKKNLRTGGFGLIAVLVLAIIVIGAGYGGYYYYNHRGGALPNEREIADLTAKIGKLIALPTDEKPTLATIADVATLAAKQPFFIGARDGDKLLIYQKARKAFIYSPSTGKLVNVGPIIFDQTTAGETTPAEESTPTTKTTVTATTTKK